MRLPDVIPHGQVVVQDVLADQAVGYEPVQTVIGSSLGRAADAGLWLQMQGAAAAVGRLPGWAAYPRPPGYTGLFTLASGQVGRWRANFRFIGCACSPSWYFEDWLVHVSNGLVARDRFREGRPDQEVDQRVHLYGGAGRSVGRRR